jgi:hypothetical protein
MGFNDRMSNFNKSMSINDVAQCAASLGKTSKKEAFDHLQQMIERATNDEEILALAFLYNQFQPALPTKPKTSFQWVAKAMPKKDIRFYLNYVYTDSNYIVATDGNRLHLTKNHQGLSGYYNKNMHSVKVDHNYPNYERAIDLDNVKYHPLNSCQFEIEAGVGKMGDFLHVTLPDDTKIMVVNDWYNQACCHGGAIEIGVAVSGSLHIRSGDNLAVIMPRRY